MFFANVSGAEAGRPSGNTPAGDRRGRPGRARARLLAALVCGAACVTATWAWGQQPDELPPLLAPPTPVAAQIAQPPAPAPAPPAEEVPAPPRVLDAGPGRIRLPLMGDALPAEQCPDPSSRTPVPTKEEMATFSKYVDTMIDPRNTLDLIVGRPRLMKLKESPSKTQIGDESIATFELLGPREMSLIGQKTGTTVLNLWFPDPNDRTRETILSYLVRVVPDPEAKARLERVYKALADEVNKAFPDSHVELFLVGDKLAVSGQAKDIAEATQILRVIRSNAPEDPVRRAPIENVQLVVPPDALASPTGLPGGPPSLGDFLVAGGPGIINLLKVPGEQQVMLRVVVAEVNRAAARSIGINFSVTNNDGITVFSQLTGNIAGGGGQFGSAGGVGGGGGGFGSVTNNLPLLLDNGQISVAINALRNLSYARFLAEPNLTALNGRTATFQAGGQFPVPVVTGFTASGLQGVSFVPFGVQLTFTPFITDKDRIRLNVAANVSARDTGTGTSINGSNVAGLNTRNFTTTVELREGQTLAVAGLIRNDLGAEATRVPLFGDIPIIGRLGAFDRTSYAEQELVILITPELVHPLEPKEVPPLPGSDLFEPGDLEFYALGRLESRRDYDYRSTVRTDIHRMLRYRHCEDLYIFGPKGHSEMPPMFQP